jgi:hypothetical protein
LIHWRRVAGPPTIFTSLEWRLLTNQECCRKGGCGLFPLIDLCFQ